MSNASEMVEISRADLAREAFKLEEASLAASALREVNRHMNEEVAIVSGERDDIRTHSEHLGKLLHEARAQLAQAPATSVPVTPSEALRDMRVALPLKRARMTPPYCRRPCTPVGSSSWGRHGKRLENILQHLRRFGRRNGWLNRAQTAPVGRRGSRLLGFLGAGDVAYGLCAHVAGEGVSHKGTLGLFLAPGGRPGPRFRVGGVTYAA
eukprot:jgi/Mesvir1/29222/Mv20416-RA.1